MASLPFVVNGTITDTDSANPSGAKVVMRNNRTGEKINTTTNASGQYILEAANLESGFMDSDTLSIICMYGDEEGTDSITISDYEGGTTVNLTLTTQAESADTTYCQPQDVLDELGDKTTDDISYERVRKIILRSESEIDERTGTKFTNTLVTDEEYDYDQYTSWKSPEQLRGWGNDLIAGSRNDYWNTYYNDRIKLEKTPIINSFTRLNGATTTTSTTLTVDSTTDFPSSGTVFIYNSTNGTEQITYTGKTSTTFTGCTRSANSTTASAHADNAYVNMIRISKNDEGKSESDSWTDLEPQLGGGGDFLIKPDSGIITFVDNMPALGIRKTKASYSYGYTTVPKLVEDLCIYLSVRRALLSKSNDDQFDRIDNISIENLSVSSGISGSASYLRWLNEEIENLWRQVGNFIQQTA